MTAIAAIYLVLLGFISASTVNVASTAFTSLPLQLIHLDKDVVLLLEYSITAPAVWRSTDMGATWTKQKTSIYWMYQSPADPATVYLVTTTASHYVSEDKGLTWKSFVMPYPPPLDGQDVLYLHPTKSNSLIYLAHRCDTGKGKTGSCRNDAYVTDNGFKSSNVLLEWAEDCVWGSDLQTITNEDKIYCQQWSESQRSGDTSKKNPNNLELVWSDTFFKSGSAKKVTFDGGVPAMGIFHRSWFLAIAVPCRNTSTRAPVIMTCTHPRLATTLQRQVLQTRTLEILRYFDVY
jgi:Sortilin, neurotensin receptor 3,